MQSKIFTIGDLKKDEKNKTWDYKQLQINIPEENVSFFPLVKTEFKIQLKFPNGKATNVKENEYAEGTFSSRIVNDHHNRFGKSTVKCMGAIWADNRTKDGLLIAWLKEYGLDEGHEVKIIKLSERLYSLEPHDMCNSTQSTNLKRTSLNLSMK